MNRIFTTLVPFLMLPICINAQAEKVGYQMVNTKDVNVLVEAFDFESQGVKCVVDCETQLSTSNAVVVEITAKSDHVPYRILASLLEVGYFDLITDEIEGRVILDVKQISHLIKYKDQEQEIAIDYKIYLPNSIHYMKYNKASAALYIPALASEK